MKIIFVSGEPNSGKSTSIGILTDKLKEYGAIEITGNYDYKDGADFEELDYVFIFKGKTVAIRDTGDECQICIDAIVRYASCDILVLGYRDTFKHSLKDLVKKFESQCGHKVIETKKVCESDIKKANEKTCDNIINLLW